MSARKPYTVLVEDPHIILVHKAPGLLSVADATGADDLPTLLSKEPDPTTGKPRIVYPIHRLDKDVSGVLIFAKTRAAQKALRRQFEENKPERVYLAAVRGAPRPPEGTISTYLDTKSRRPTSVAPDKGVPAVTHYRILDRAAKSALLEVKLETGRKNQIRAHFAERGHPLLGDRLYGGEETAGFDRRRIGLHAWTLRLTHPITGEPVEAEAPVPVQFGRMFRGVEAQIPDPRSQIKDKR